MPHPRKATGLLLILLAGCNTDGCDTSGLRELAAKEPRAVNFPGEELAPVGAFTPRHALGRDGELLAIAGVNDAGSVVIVPSGRAGNCVVATLPEGGAVSQLVPAALEDMLVTLESRSDAGLGRLHVHDSNCEPVGEPFEQARPVPRTERLLPQQLLLVANTSDLIAISPSDRERRIVDTKVASVTIASEYVVVHAGAQLIVRDMGLGEVRRLGDAVTEVIVNTNRQEIAFVDGGRLKFLADPLATPQLLDDGACGIQFADQASRAGDGGTRFLSYFGSCDAAELVVYDRQEGRRLEVGSATSSFAEARAMEVAGRASTAVFFLKASTAGDGDVLAVSVDGNEPTELGPGALSGVGRTTSAGVRVWLGAGTDESRIVTWSGDADGKILLSKVQDFAVGTYPERAVLDTGDGALSLVAIEGFVEPTVVANGPSDAGGGSSDILLFGERVEDGVGDLRMLRADVGRVEEIADGAYLPASALAYSSESLLYLGHYDSALGIGELCMRIVRSADTFCEPGVVSFQAMFRPSRAIAYVKQVGTQRRLFWARVE